MNEQNTNTGRLFPIPAYYWNRTQAQDAIGFLFLKWIYGPRPATSDDGYKKNSMRHVFLYATEAVLEALSTGRLGNGGY